MFRQTNKTGLALDIALAQHILFHIMRIEKLSSDFVLLYYSSLFLSSFRGRATAPKSLPDMISNILAHLFEYSFFLGINFAFVSSYAVVSFISILNQNMSA